VEVGFAAKNNQKWESEGEAMSSALVWESPAAYTPVVDSSPQWYAIHTRSRHEKRVAARLQEQGITTFVPFTTEARQWSDRRKLVDLPLFSCYAFVNVARLPEARNTIVRTDGVLGFVGFCGGAIPIPDIEIASIRTLLDGVVPFTSYPFLKIGQRVRVRGGSLDGVEGILVSRSGDETLVISVGPIQRSIALKLDGYSVEPV
jgi:transcription antitermination factor NusG